MIHLKMIFYNIEVVWKGVLIYLFIYLFIYLLICLFIYSFICLFIYLFFIYLFIYLSIYLFVYLFICLFICLFIYPFIYIGRSEGIYFLILNYFSRYFSMSLALQPGFSDPWKPPLALSSTFPAILLLPFLPYLSLT